MVLAYVYLCAWPSHFVAFPTHYQLLEAEPYSLPRSCNLVPGSSGSNPPATNTRELLPDFFFVALAARSTVGEEFETAIIALPWTPDRIVASCMLL